MAKPSTGHTTPARSLRRKHVISDARIRAYLLAREALRRACQAAAGGKTIAREDAR